MVVALLGANFAAGYLGASALEARLARLEQQLREVAARPRAPEADRRAVDELAGRLARLEAALANPRPGAPDPALANRLAILEGEVKAMAETVSILGRRSDDIGVTAREARQRVDTLAAALAELTQKVNRLGAPAIERRELEALASRVDAIERGEKAVEAELARRTDSGDRPLRLAVVAATLKGAVERGDPFAAELDAAKALAPDAKALAPLEPFAATGVPTAAALARELAALAPALYQAAGAPRARGQLPRQAAGERREARARAAGRGDRRHRSGRRRQPRRGQGRARRSPRRARRAGAAAGRRAGAGRALDQAGAGPRRRARGEPPLRRRCPCRVGEVMLVLDGAASSVCSLSHRERDGVRGYGLSIDPTPLTPTLSPAGRGSPPSSRRHFGSYDHLIFIALP